MQISSTKGKSSRNEFDSDTDPDSDDDIVEIKDETVGWAYVGSHNFTPSAWGTLSGSSFNPVMNVGLRCDFCDCQFTELRGVDH